MSTKRTTTQQLADLKKILDIGLYTYTPKGYCDYLEGVLQGLIAVDSPLVPYVYQISLEAHVLNK